MQKSAAKIQIQKQKQIFPVSAQKRHQRHQEKHKLAMMMNETSQKKKAKEGGD